MKFDLERFTNLYKSQLPPRVVMVQIIQGFWQSRAIYLIAKLGMPDLLKDKPKSSGELARSTGMHPILLYRLLRALGSIGNAARTTLRY